MTSLYEISYYGIEQHITLTLPAWLCLFTVRNYITLLNTLALHAIRWCSGICLLLRMAKVPGLRRTQYYVVSVIIPPATKLGGGVYWNHPVRPSVRPSVCPSVDARLGKMVSSA